MVFPLFHLLSYLGTDDDDDADGYIKIHDFNDQDMDFILSKVHIDDDTDISDDCRAILKK